MDRCTFKQMLKFHVAPSPPSKKEELAMRPTFRICAFMETGGCDRRFSWE